jgi:hypothetical protein
VLGKALVNGSSALAEQARQDIAAGIVNGVSIGFQPISSVEHPLPARTSTGRRP